ncbi:CoA ester lyase [Variovorax sp. J22R24]|uniref:HpcH/HpaI aldolase/citrate lyase family protein n=1 Tax=Variovorax gracilis TaxID=3053502 RepID=UPI00257684CF|nr:CoA ester lyase [Variovorax sp. J22R24]MDM0109471.1 CoA ester lyase [Variovorax sp. J22R24]
MTESRDGPSTGGSGCPTNFFSDSTYTMSNLKPERCATARSFLFVPANRPDRFDKALNSGADVIILDLEDSVPSQDKALAREAVSACWQAIAQQDVCVVVRINAEGSPEWNADIELVSRLPGLGGILLPKAERTSTLELLGERLRGIRILALIESAAGLDNLKAIAGMPNVVRLVVGHIDFMADTGIACSEDERELDPLRFAVSMASRGAGLAPPVDGVTVQTTDARRLAADTLRGKRFGFAGKLCIHPQQVAGVHAAFAPSANDVLWARRVLEADAASNGAAVQLDGRMVDLPVVLQARRTLAMVGTSIEP